MTIKSQLAAMGLFDAKVPRYTSYPTAPHFAGGVTGAQFGDWVRSIAPGSAISLYVHVPFCRRLCWFCACRTQGTKSDAPVIAYLKTLRAELAMLKKALPRDVRLARLHWGGGTPTLLTPAMITDLAGAIAEVTPFARDAEFSVEIDPGEIDGPRLDALGAAGMNRASIGVQDFDPKIQDCIGRLQSYDLTRDAVEGLRARGITSLNADILYGLPHQTGARITESVQKLLSLSPDRVALYGYAHVPWMSKRQQMIPSDALPTPQERLALYETARDLFLWDGYAEIGIDHFATRDDSMARAAEDGTLKRNFQGYTVDPSDVLIGLGASSISRFPQGYAQNTAATGLYTAAIREGRFATARGHAFAGDDLLRGRMIEMLMCSFFVDTAALGREFGLSRPRLNELLAPVASAFPGVVTLDARGLHLSDEGRPLARMVARALDAYEMDKAGHSAAI